MTFPTPHNAKLMALRDNAKLPDNDKPRVIEAIEKYEAWIEDCKNIVRGNREIVELLVSAASKTTESPETRQTRRRKPAVETAATTEYPEPRPTELGACQSLAAKNSIRYRIMPPHHRTDDRPTKSASSPLTC